MVQWYTSYSFAQFNTYFTSPVFLVLCKPVLYEIAQTISDTLIIQKSSKIAF